MTSLSSSDWINPRTDNSESTRTTKIPTSSSGPTRNSVRSSSSSSTSSSLSTKAMYTEYAKQFIDACQNARKALQYTLTTNTPYYRHVGLNASSSVPESSSSSSANFSTVPSPSGNIHVTVPTLLRAELQSHQKQGLRWLLAGRYSSINGILADEMGLGKTIQVIAYFAQLLQWEIEDLQQSSSSPLALWTMDNDTYTAITTFPSSGTDADTTIVSSNDSTDNPASIEPLLIASTTTNSITKKIRQVQNELAELNQRSITETTVSNSTKAIDHLVRSLSSTHRSYHVHPWAWATGIANVSTDTAKDLAEDTLDSLRFRRGSAGPHLIICPSSVMTNWENEIKRFCPWLCVTVYRPVGNDKIQRKKMKERLQKSNVIVCNYNTFERGSHASDMFTEREWDTLVLDEAHDMKNSASARFANVSELTARHRILLTGTPVQNNLHELVSLLRFVLRDDFLTHSNGQYTSNDDVWLDDNDENGGDSDVQKKFVEALSVQVNAMVKSKGVRKPVSEAGTSANDTLSTVDSTDALADMLSLFILRRTKESIQLNLPPKIRQDVWLPPVHDQAAILRTLHYTALSILGSDSIVGKALMQTLAPTALAGKDGNLTMDTVLEHLRSQRMAFVGQLCGAVTETSSSSSSLSSSTNTTTLSLANLEGRSGFVGKLLSLLRKASIHPLLLRSWYSNEQCLNIAKFLYTQPGSSVTSHDKRTTGKRTRYLTSGDDRYIQPDQIRTLKDLVDHHPALSSADLLHWANGDKNLVRQAEHVLALPDYSIHQLLLSLPTSVNNSLLLPPEAFRDTPKMNALLDILGSLPPRSKSLVFSGFTEVLDITALVLQDAGISTMRIDGQTDIDRRQTIINEFSSVTSTPSASVMLLSTRAGGVGINLTVATTVIFLDQDWNAQVMLQAEARAHRIGQTFPVHVYRILTEQTIESHMVHIADEKHTLSHVLLKGTEKSTGSNITIE